MTPDEALLNKLEAAQDADKGVRLTAQEVDDLLWKIGEQEIAIDLQRHMIGMLEASYRPADATIN